MSEFRQNRATKEWVIVAPGRGKRPSDFAKIGEKREPMPAFKETCPFCPGHEDQTPPTIFQLPPDGLWQTRVVTNKFAALSPEMPATRNPVGTFLSANGYGVADGCAQRHRNDCAHSDAQPCADGDTGPCGCTIRVCRTEWCIRRTFGAQSEKIPGACLAHA